MQIANITRKYIFLNGNREKIELEDIDPEMGHERIMEHSLRLYLLEKSFSSLPLATKSAW